MSEPILKIDNLKVYFNTELGVVKAVDGVDFELERGKTLGIVGESGCGKSVTAMSTMQLIPIPPGEIVDGKIYFNGRDLLSLSQSEMREIRGNEISMIFQEPMTSLNPVYTIGNQISEALILHRGMDKKEAMKKSIEMLKLVKIPRAEKIVKQYPHSLSGGMRQRVMIAMALACNPKLLIADEPTTALDVTIQAQILDLIVELQHQLNTSIIIITHDLGVIAEIADQVVVMYAGKVVEQGDVQSIFDEPKHPYTIGLHNSMPKLEEKKRRLESIEGNVPNPAFMPKGCKFHPRCKNAMDICKRKEPPLIIIGKNKKVRCWLYDD